MTHKSRSFLAAALAVAGIGLIGGSFLQEPRRYVE